MTTLSGTLYLKGAAVTGSLWLEICQRAVGSGGVNVTPNAPYVFQLTAGQISGPGSAPYSVPGNDTLTPANTWYVATVFGADGAQLVRGNVSITGASADIGAFAAAATSGWVPPGGLGTGTAGKLAKWISASQVGDSIVTESSGKIGINVASPEASLHAAAEGVGTVVGLFDSYAGNPNFISRRANGTQDSPTAVLAAQGIGGLAARGYGATGWSSGGRAAVVFVSAENWTDTAQGAYVAFYVTKAGTILNVEAVRITDDGRVKLNSGPDIVTGAGSPEGAVAAVVGSLYLRTDGGAGTTLYVKESGTGTTGWAAK